MPPNAETGSHGPRTLERFLRGGAKRDAARRGVLHDAAGDPGAPARHGPHSGVDVEQVVEGKFLALALGEIPGAARLFRHVESRALSRVLAVTERHEPLHRQPEPAWQALFHRGEEAGDGRVVIRQVCENLGGELPSQDLVDLALAQLLQHEGIVERIGDDDDLGVVLRRRAEHRWPADIDVLYRVIEGDARLRHRLLEGIEVHRHQVDRLDSVPGDRGPVLREVAPGEDAAVHGGVQRLHPAVEHLGEGR